MAKKKVRLKKWVKWTLIVIIAISILAFLQYRHANRVCSKVDINIDETLGHYFLNKKSILELLTNNGDEYLIGAKIKNINTKILELRVKNNKFVDNCEVYHNMLGELQVVVTQVEPIARLMNTKIGDCYIDTEGAIFKTSSQYTARVLLVTYDKKVSPPDFEVDHQDQMLLKLIQKIHKDPVWKAQIAQIYIDRNNNVTLYMQVGRPKVLFGKLNNLDKKLSKLSILYDQILPTVGWSRYKSVNLMYHNQIIGE